MALKLQGSSSSSFSFSSFAPFYISFDSRFRVEKEKEEEEEEEEKGKGGLFLDRGGGRPHYANPEQFKDHRVLLNNMPRIPAIAGLIAIYTVQGCLYQ